MSPRRKPEPSDDGKMTVRVAVVGNSPEHEPDIFFATVTCRFDQYMGNPYTPVYKAAKDAADREGWEGPYITIDEYADGFSRILADDFDAEGDVAGVVFVDVSDLKPEDSQ